MLPQIYSFSAIDFATIVKLEKRFIVCPKVLIFINVSINEPRQIEEDNCHFFYIIND